MSPEEIRALGPTTDVVIAGSFYGAGRSLSYDLARRGEFPVPVLRLGRKFRVRTADLIADLFGDTQEAGPTLPP